MNEIFLTVPSTHPFYQRCLNWHKADREVFEKAKEYMASLGVSKDDFVIGYNDIGIKDTPRFRELFKGKYKISGQYLLFKRNTKIGREWTEKRPMKPSVCIDLSAVTLCGRFGEVKFIYEDALYARVHGAQFHIPEGFSEIPGSKFYGIVEKINKEKLEYIRV